MVSQTQLNSDALLKVLFDYAEFRWDIVEVSDSWACPVKEYAYIWLDKKLDCIELAWNKEGEEYVLTVVGNVEAGEYSLNTSEVDAISIDKLDIAFAQAREDGFVFVRFKA